MRRRAVVLGSRASLAADMVAEQGFLTTYTACSVS